MEGTLVDGIVEVGANGRERFYDARGYGRPRGDGVVLSRVEAAHLLYRGDLDAVDGSDFGAFLAANDEILVPFVVYKDLRDRGFYLSPARNGWVEEPEGIDFVVHPRGTGPWDGEVEHRIRVVSERTDVPASSIGDAVVAVVDEESEITYLETESVEISGSSSFSLDSPADGTVLGDRVLCWDPPEAIYRRGFYGQPLSGEDGPLQLSLLEAVYLAETGCLEVDGGAERLRARARADEADRFDRRLVAYRELRERGVVPKTGLKFGTDFRTYEAVEDVSSLGHSELLVRVVPVDRVFAPSELALDVRLAHGVRKRMVFALVDGERVRWLSVARLTP